VRGAPTAGAGVGATLGVGLGFVGPLFEPPPFGAPPLAGRGEGATARTGPDDGGADGTGSSAGDGSTGADGVGSTTGGVDGCGGGGSAGSCDDGGRVVEAGVGAGAVGLGAPVLGPGPPGVAMPGVGWTTAIGGLVDSEIPTPRATPASRMLMTPSVSTSRSRCAAVTSVRHSRSSGPESPKPPPGMVALARRAGRCSR
jgi:hypothetical protein